MDKFRFTIREFCFAGIFTALIVAASQLVIPMPYGVPMTLQTFVVPLAGMVLGAKVGTVSVLAYVALGAAGVPVFAGFTGGLGVVFGMTGGFILSFPIMALAAGLGEKKNKALWSVSGLVAGAAVNYICGMLWFAFMAGCGLKTAFLACVLPFVPTAILKIVLVYVFGRQIRRVLAHRNILPS